MRPSTHTQKAGETPFAVFLASAIVIFFCSLSVADSLGFVPYYIDGSPSSDSARDTSLTANGTDPQAARAEPSSVQISSLPQLGEESVSAVSPTRIVVPAIDLDLPVQNPATRDIGILDALLQSGPARYVDSAKLGERGNVLIFAHSSHLPIVHNQMFRAFNRIPDLTAGDDISVYGSDGKTYRYAVASVRKADAADAAVDLSKNIGSKLTLVTCDTFTGKSARWILEADFVGEV